MESPFILAQRLERQLLFRLAQVDRDSLSNKERTTIDLIRREMADARLDIRDYELSETRGEQLDNAKEGKRRLNLVSSNVLAASEYNVFGAADVAQLGAQIEQISSRLQ